MTHLALMAFFNKTRSILLIIIIIYSIIESIQSLSLIDVHKGLKQVIASVLLHIHLVLSQLDLVHLLLLHGSLLTHRHHLAHTSHHDTVLRLVALHGILLVKLLLLKD